MSASGTVSARIRDLDRHGLAGRDDAQLGRMDECRVGAGTLSLAALAHLRDAVAPLDGLLTAGIGHEHDRRWLRLGARRALGLGRRGRRFAIAGLDESARLGGGARLGRRRAKLGRWRLGLRGRIRAAARGERRAGEKRHQHGEEAAARHRRLGP